MEDWKPGDLVEFRYNDEIWTTLLIEFLGYDNPEVLHIGEIPSMIFKCYVIGFYGPEEEKNFLHPFLGKFYVSSAGGWNLISRPDKP